MPCIMSLQAVRCLVPGLQIAFTGSQKLSDCV
nr:MAG TPA: hypothetical protein [Caudoviricetes sp.]